MPTLTSFACELSRHSPYASSLRYDWTMFDSEAKLTRQEEVFPSEKQKAFMLGAEMVSAYWK